MWLARARRLCGGVLVCCVLSSPALGAGAQAAGQLPLSLAWQAPQGCPDQVSVRAELERIARVQPGRTPSALIAEGSIARVEGGYTLSLRTERDGQVGERVLDARTCGSLARAATLVLALAFGEGVELRSIAEPAPEPEPKPEPRAAPAPTPAPPAPPPAAVPERVDLALDLSGVGALGWLPELAAGLGVGVGAGRERWELRLDLAALPHQRVARANEVHVRWWSLGGALSGCARLPLGPVLVAGCAGLDAALLSAAGEGSDADRQVLAPRYGVRLGGALSWPRTGRVALRLALDGSIALHALRFEVRNQGSVHEASRTLGLLRTGLLLRL